MAPLFVLLVRTERDAVSVIRRNVSGADASWALGLARQPGARSDENRTDTSAGLAGAKARHSHTRGCIKTAPAGLKDTPALQHLLRQPPGGVRLVRAPVDDHVENRSILDMINSAWPPGLGQVWVRLVPDVDHSRLPVTRKAAVQIRLPALGVPLFPLGRPRHGRATRSTKSPDAMITCWLPSAATRL